MENLEVRQGNQETPVKSFKSGELQKTENGWVVVHNIIDPYGQIPHPLPLHPDIKIDNDKNGKKVDFELVYEYFAKIETSSEKPNLKSLEQHNAEKLNLMPTGLANFFPEKNGIACPNCSEELYDSNPMVTLASIPPQKNIKCDNCNYSGYRIA